MMALDYNTIPRFEDVVTNEWLNAAITNGSWDPEHGSGLERWIDDLKEGVFAPKFILPEHLNEADDIAILDDAEFRATLAGWLKTRYGRVITDLNETDLSRVGRRMSVDDTWLPSLLEGKGSLGVYWGDLPLDGGDFWYDEDKPMDVYIEINPSCTDIDWISTIRARMDYVFGDDEREIRLKEDAMVSITSLEIDGVAQITMAGRIISTGKPWPRNQLGHIIALAQGS